MLNVEIDHKSNKQSIEVQGNLLDITGEILFLINQIYMSFTRNDPAVAAAMKHMITGSVADGLPFMKTGPGKNERQEETFFSFPIPNQD